MPGAFGHVVNAAAMAGLPLNRATVSGLKSKEKFESNHPVGFMRTVRFMQIRPV